MSRKTYLERLKGNVPTKTISKKEIIREQEIPEIHQRIKDFFISKKVPPTDDEVHAFAADIGMDEHELENHIYMMIHNMLKRRFGKVNEEFDINKYDPKELEMGREVEKEHTNTLKWVISQLGGDPESEESKGIIDKAIEMISGDHLDEIKKYYTFLVKMEKEAGIE